MTEKEKWYRDGLKFGCKQCGRCCTGEEGYVWVTDAEIAALAKAARLTVFNFESAFVRYVPEMKKKSLKEFANGDCVLWDSQTKGCRFYELRPIQCSTWPFWEQNIDSPNSWKKTAKFCPGCRNPQGRLYSLDEIQYRAEQTFK